MILKLKDNIKMLLMIITIIFISCDNNGKMPRKPFIITYTSPLSGWDEYAEYIYYDADSTRYQFTDLRQKYSVGDTIK
jgi:hypothetical protein